MGCDYTRGYLEFALERRIAVLRKKIGPLTLDKFKGEHLVSLLKVMGLHRLEANEQDVELLEKRILELDDPDGYIKENGQKSKIPGLGIAGKQIG